MRSKKKRKKRSFLAEIVGITGLLLVLVMLIHDNKALTFTSKALPYSIHSTNASASYEKGNISESLFPTPIQPSDEKVVYLTFDDGPNEASNDILDILQKYDAKATFFMLEPNMTTYKQSVLRMRDEGHTLALHGVTHDQHIFYASSSSVLQELNQGQSTLASITGEVTRLIRTPYGSIPHMTPTYRKAVQDHDYILWDWNVDSKDWAFRDKRYVQEVMEGVHKLAGSNQPIIILMHEKTTTAAHLDLLLSQLDAEGYAFKELTDDMDPVQFQS
ncbi:polysaccharide deacetylase family protein [Pontibacillus litoralis]|uniref:NodB homology domain-containing protein n=1 Tax=Pontibacillus litoralis JSM 072002 TaxID=1385512 RepID=A0A0A5G3A3_9BACI|nr:polysaccharide deacetylase family protein [Pontibacillus litoralis]KGX87591.1 hypothetical protein N784_15195 [Pontibacillus litoralis JSM 072002]